VPRAMIGAVLITALISAFWLVAMALAIPDIAKTQAQGTNAIAYVFEAHFAKWVTDLFLVSVCVAIFVCCLAIQAACTRLLFAYGRDKMVPASRFFSYVHPRTKTPLFSALFLGAAVVAILAYVSSSGNPAMAFARIISGATALTYFAYQMVMIAGLYARSKGYPKDKAYFNLGRWGWAVNITALVYGVLMIINLAWPRPTVGTAWYDRWNVVIVGAIILVAGIIVYLIQRARGVDLSATIHEIELAPAQAEAMAGMEGVVLGEAGPAPATEAGTLDMAGDQAPDTGPVSVDPPSGPQMPGGPQTPGGPQI